MDDSEFNADIYTDANKLKVLLGVYEGHSELLKALTQIDLRIFGGYITIQMVSAGFILSHPKPFDPLEFIGVVTMSFVVSFIAFMMVRANSRRRGEAALIMQNTNIALGLREEGFFLCKERLHFYWSDETSTPSYRPWGNFYMIGVIVGWIGLLLITLSKQSWFTTCVTGSIPAS